MHSACFLVIFFFIFYLFLLYKQTYHSINLYFNVYASFSKRGKYTKTANIKEPHIKEPQKKQKHKNPWALLGLYKENRILQENHTYKQESLEKRRVKQISRHNKPQYDTIDTFI
ncbi:hypothetical protein NERG_02414 [Nematocida ausubeli]|uniref:Uncharacterized protein n=1 Tax=Nematocida ausubeli (strain ATCC PRA-371 / ERTm2) TaxID=1913371 RepID=H8ZFP3_NEMA1|nr:hypothetical protein NERG_02414 [Nematocida ausubeli]